VNGFLSFCIFSVPSHTLSTEPAPSKRETGVNVLMINENTKTSKKV
jgi:hypothetical protein